MEYIINLVDFYHYTIIYNFVWNLLEKFHRLTFNVGQPIAQSFHYYL